jgi:hypothetical protein
MRNENGRGHALANFDTREMPPETNLQTHEATQAELVALKSQMVELLATIF